MYYFLVLLIFAIYATHDVSAKELCPNMTEMNNCVTHAETHWGIDRNKKDEKFKSWCCFQWEAYECQMNIGSHCVGDFDAKKFNVSMAAIHTDLEDDCHEYPADSCGGLQWWAITLIVIASLAVLVIIGVLIFILLSRNKKRYSSPK